MKINLEELAYPLTSRETKPNKAMKEIVMPFLQGHGVQKILDYGCGKFLRDSFYLSEKGFTVDALDLAEQIERIDPVLIQKIHSISTNLENKDYDTVMLNFVLQVLPTQKQRDEVLGNALSALKKNGYFILSLRNKNEIDRDFYDGRGALYKDGFIMKTGKYRTFVRGYTRKEMEDIIQKEGLDTIIFERTFSSFVSVNRKK